MWAAAVPAGHHPHLCSQARKLLASVPPDIAQALCTSHPAFPDMPPSRATVEQRASALHEALQKLPLAVDSAVFRALLQPSPLGPCLALNLAHLHTVHRLCTALASLPGTRAVALTCDGAHSPRKLRPGVGYGQDDECWVAGYNSGIEAAAWDTAMLAVRPSTQLLACALPQVGIEIVSFNTMAMKSEHEAAWQAVADLVRVAGAGMRDMHAQCAVGAPGNPDALYTGAPARELALRATGSMLLVAGRLQALTLDCTELDFCSIACVLRAQLAAAPCLRKLTLRNPCKQKLSTPDERGLLLALPSLQALHVENVVPEIDENDEMSIGVDRALAAGLACNLAASTGLHTLVCEDTSFLGWSPLASLLAAAPGLRALRLASLSIWDAMDHAGFVPFTSALQQLTHLTSVEITIWEDEHVRFTAGYHQSLAPAVTASPQLRSLVLHDLTYLGSAGATTLAQRLPCVPMLTRLELVRCQIVADGASGMRGACALARALPCLQCLVCFDVREEFGQQLVVDAFSKVLAQIGLTQLAPH
jgi:hypothetical protein